MTVFWLLVNYEQSWVCLAKTILNPIAKKHFLQKMFRFPPNFYTLKTISDWLLETTSILGVHHLIFKEGMEVGVR